MASRKEEEKNERIIRSLLKQPGNRKCINCNLLGPQYVCITFSTFVCTTCSGIHREFTHRVKSVSMAKFSPQEIASLQAGGNERAKEIFFKDWESSNPDNSNVDKLRNFIKHVYVDRRYTGEKSIDKLQGDREEPNRRSDPYRSTSRSPPYDDERRHSDRPSPGHEVRRSPVYLQEERRHSDYGRSPVRTGIVSDWRREDRFANGRMSDDRRSSDGEVKLEIRSPDSQSGSGISSPPPVRPVSEILGENVVPLRISEPPRANGNSNKITQRTASSSSLASSNGNSTELRNETTLIDFGASSESVVATQVHQPVVGQSLEQATSATSDDNWACFDNVVENNVVENNVSQTPPKAPSTNTFESLFLELSVPAPGPAPSPAPAPVFGVANGGGGAFTPSKDVLVPSSSSDFLFDSAGSTLTTAMPGASVTSSFPSGSVASGHGLAPSMPANGGAQWRGMQNPQQPPQQPSLAAVNQPAVSPLVSGYPSGFSNQGVAGNAVAQTSHTFAQIPQAVPAHTVQTTEAEGSRKQALPENLFTTAYSSIPYQGPGWQTGVFPGRGYPMQYNTAMSMPTYPQPVKSANPFDVNAEASPSQAAAFPSMSSLHTALPNMAAPGGSLHGSSFGGGRPSWMLPQQTSYPQGIPSHGPSFAPPTQGAYMGHQQHSNMPPSRPQGFGTFNNQGTHFGNINPSVTAPNPSTGGNPFG